MKKFLAVIAAYIILLSCSKEQTREVEDFNLNWKFSLVEVVESFDVNVDDTEWRTLNLPHDWSIEEGYQKEGTSASTGFVKGGIGWYRKSFEIPVSDKGKQISIVFDGIYNNSRVWINGHFLGYRPYGYSTFAYDLSSHLNYGSKNVIAVKVDRTTYVDSRWYTGSGIYRKVQLIKKSPVHIAQWGVQITTPKITAEFAEIRVNTKLEVVGKTKFGDLSLSYSIIDGIGNTVSQLEVDLSNDGSQVSSSNLQIVTPKLWGIDTPNLYTLVVELIEDGKLIDNTSEVFGVRTFKFDASEGFSLNGERMKIKGVNLHHDAGAVGAAVPKGLWQYRIEKLKSIGVNAVRLSHNPHSVELLEVCDEFGILVMDEAFDEWSKPKGKSLIFAGDNKAPKEASRSYPEHFNEWSERDLKDLILRDFNHPSIIMWSIGNEIEWTFPHYSKTYSDVNGKGVKYYKHKPKYDYNEIKTALDKNTGGVDSLALIAKKLMKWVKELDTTRPVISGCVHPSIASSSGYAEALDILGFNYRAVEYDAAHEAYPEMKIIGSENWGAYSEWKACVERDYVAGIFAWTGFAYLGEAGPWPRKGLEISYFDFAGNKTPRGHFFECLWVDKPKVYMVTTSAEESEFSYSPSKGWQFDIQLYEPPYWPELRLWEWYDVYEKWNYNNDEEVVVQTYTNCEEAELFLNDKSLGKQKLADFADDNIIKWLVPYTQGELKVIGYNKGEKTSEYVLNSQGTYAKLTLKSSKLELSAGGYDVAVINAELLDEKDNLITNEDYTIKFEISGVAKNIGIDNGWERNIQSHMSNQVKTHAGKAILIIQSLKETGSISIKAISNGIKSNELEIVAN